MEVPYRVDLHQSYAKELLKSTATLLILDIPTGSSIGVNLQMFVVGPNFKGVKMLLPGAHFVCYSSRNSRGGDSSPVTGFFVHASPSQVIVRRWDPREEALVKLSDTDEELRYSLAVKAMDFDRHIAPYDLSQHNTWKLLSNFITPAVISQLEPVGGDITIMAESAISEQGFKTPAERRLDQQIAKTKELHAQKIPPTGFRSASNVDELTAGVNGPSESKGRCFYTHLPQLIKRAGVTATDLTALNMDKTQVLEAVLLKEYREMEELLLGELQFSFVAFLMGQSLESFVQWKRIVSLMLRCEEGPLFTRTKLFTKFLGVVYWQLRHSLRSESLKASSSRENDAPVLDEAWLSEDNFFRLLFKEFFEMLMVSQPVDGELLHQAKRLKKLFETTLGWSFEQDGFVDNPDDEFSPVVVSLEGCTTAD